MMEHVITVGDILMTMGFSAIVCAVIVGIACLGVDQGWWG